MRFFVAGTAASSRCRPSVRIEAAPLADGLIGGTTLVCPLHAWKFDLATGDVLMGDCGIKTFPVRVDEKGQIVVTVSKAG